jgi:hypothetical protein
VSKKTNLAYKFLEAEAKLSTGTVYKYKLWLMENTKLFTKINKNESHRVRSRCDGKVKECYYNCWKALSLNQHYRYYEGYVNSKRIPIPLEHSWLVNKKNEVIDPTLIIDVDKKIKNRLGDEYLGVEIPREYAYKKGFKTKKSGPYILDYFFENSK